MWCTYPPLEVEQVAVGWWGADQAPRVRQDRGAVEEAQSRGACCSSATCRQRLVSHTTTSLGRAGGASAHLSVVLAARCTESTAQSSPGSSSAGARQLPSLA